MNRSGRSNSRRSPAGTRRRATDSSPGSADFYPAIMREGWRLLPELIDPGVARLLFDFANDPTPLCAALARYPQTAVHGDPRPPNLGMLRTPEPRVILLDWQFVGPGAPAVDLAWRLYRAFARAPMPIEASIGHYRRLLRDRLGSRFADVWWRPQLELSLLGQAVRNSADLAWMTRCHPSSDVRRRGAVERDWWIARAKEGLRWL